MPRVTRSQTKQPEHKFKPKKFEKHLTLSNRSELNVNSRTTDNFKLVNSTKMTSVKSKKDVNVVKKSTPIPESSKIPFLTQSSAIKRRRLTVHYGQLDQLKGRVSKAFVKPTGDAKQVNSTNNMVTAGDVDPIIISDELKTVLLNDSNNINGRKKLYKIPTELNVLKVIDDYIAMKCLDESILIGRVIEKVFHDMIDEYFEKFLRSHLLYDFEHTQYDAILRTYPGIAMSNAYPPVYLLRLLVQLNKLLPYSRRDITTLRLILKYINEFVVYLAEHKTTFFD